VLRRFRVRGRCRTQTPKGHRLRFYLPAARATIRCIYSHLEIPWPGSDGCFCICYYFFFSFLSFFLFIFFASLCIGTYTHTHTRTHILRLRYSPRNPSFNDRTPLRFCVPYGYTLWISICIRFLANFYRGRMLYIIIYSVHSSNTFTSMFTINNRFIQIIIFVILRYSLEFIILYHLLLRSDSNFVFQTRTKNRVIVNC